MSAFMVSKAHIDAMIQAGLRGHHTFGTLAWYVGPERRELTDETANDVGATLWAENRRSVNHRYREDESEPVYVFHHSPYAVMDAVAILKAINCYEYQSCETDEWASSESAAFCDSLRRHMIRQLPGYDDAEWEITDKTPARRRA